MKWFGTNWGAPLCDEGGRVPVSDVLGLPCLYCKEPIGLADDGVVVPYVGDVMTEEPEHIECFVRQISGSCGHQDEQCSCYGREDSSEQGLSRREAARRAYRRMRMRGGRIYGLGNL